MYYMQRKYVHPAPIIQVFGEVWFWVAEGGYDLHVGEQLLLAKSSWRRKGSSKYPV